MRILEDDNVLPVVQECFVADLENDDATPITIVKPGEAEAWLESQSPVAQAWLKSTNISSTNRPVLCLTVRILR